VEASTIPVQPESPADLLRAFSRTGIAQQLDQQGVVHVRAPWQPGLPHLDRCEGTGALDGRQQPKTLRVSQQTIDAATLVGESGDHGIDRFTRVPQHGGRRKRLEERLLPGQRSTMDRNRLDIRRHRQSLASRPERGQRPGFAPAPVTAEEQSLGEFEIVASS
jgi:hypothetical protein